MDDVVLISDPRVTELPVEEVEDELVDVRLETGLALDPAKATEDGAFAFLRRGLAHRLAEADAALPDGFRLLLVEGYRPYALQTHYFTRYRDELRALDPTLDDAESHRLASRYVAPPEVAPHVSGAAIDLTLTDSDGRVLDLGTPINATPEESDGGCYFAAENISAEGRHHRELLATVLESVGLVNYPTEWWHWSYGDRYWAFATRRPAAIYGPVH